MRWRALMQRLAVWSAAWIFAGALYLLLIDTTSLPELIVGAAAASLAATGFELARDRHTREAFRLGWLAKSHRPLVKVPSDIAMVSFVALRQLLRWERSCGEFRAVPFHSEEDARHQYGRTTLAEAMGSFAPNTIIVGVEPERELILAHQLRPSGGREAIDLMELG